MSRSGAEQMFLNECCDRVSIAGMDFHVMKTLKSYDREWYEMEFANWIKHDAVNVQVNMSFFLKSYITDPRFDGRFMDLAMGIHRHVNNDEMWYGSDGHYDFSIIDDLDLPELFPERFSKKVA